MSKKRSDIIFGQPTIIEHNGLKKDFFVTRACLYDLP